MQIKRFEARDMTEALKMIKNEFGSQAVILSAKTLKKSNGIFGAVRKTGVEITAASDQYRSIDLKEQMPVEKERNEEKLKIEDKITILPERSKNENVEISSHELIDENRKNESPLIEKLSLNLHEQGLDNFLAQNIVDSIVDATRHQSFLSMEDVKAAFIQTVRDKITISPSVGPKENRAKTVAFVGPTGVGKTTTIAKLSVLNALQKKYSVALISMDCHRVGATITLEKYAGIIGLQYRMVGSEEELKNALNEFRNNQLIFIDTPGLAISDQDKIVQLGKQFASVSIDEVHLLLSAGTKDKDMHLLCKTYRPCGANRLIFTKIDETSSFGNLLNLLDKENIPLSYVTNGQKIPEHIVSALPDTVAELLFNFTYIQNLSDNQNTSEKGVIRSSQSNFLPPGDCYVANKNSDIFHHRDCKSVERINMSNIVVFQNMSDAKSQSFKPCRMCCVEKGGSDRLMQKFKFNVAVGH